MALIATGEITNIAYSVGRYRHFVARLRDYHYTYHPLIPSLFKEGSGGGGNATNKLDCILEWQLKLKFELLKYYMKN
jgi:hypothetical protein